MIDIKILTTITNLVYISIILIGVIAFIIHKIITFFTSTYTVCESDLHQDIWKTYRRWNNKLINQQKVINHLNIFNPYCGTVWRLKNDNIEH